MVVPKLERRVAYRLRYLIPCWCPVHRFIRIAPTLRSAIDRQFEKTEPARCIMRGNSAEIEVATLSS